MNQLKNKKELQKFGRNFTIVFLLWGIILWWRGKLYYPVFFLLAAVFLILTIIFPSLLGPIEKNWLRLTKFISKIITATVLMIFYYLILTPIGVGNRLFGGKFLDLKIDKGQKSYWLEKKKGDEAENYNRQF